MVIPIGNDITIIKNIILDITPTHDTKLIILKSCKFKNTNRAKGK